MKKICTIAFISLFSITLSAQPTIVWKGGFPGQENVWNCPKNWSKYRVPDRFDRVLIPDVSANGGYPPIISAEAEPVGGLLIASGAGLEITSAGSLEVKGSEGITNLGWLHIDGYLEVHHPNLPEPVSARPGQSFGFTGSGLMILINEYALTATAYRRGMQPQQLCEMGSNAFTHPVSEKKVLRNKKRNSFQSGFSATDLMDGISGF